MTAGQEPRGCQCVSRSGRCPFPAAAVVTTTCPAGHQQTGVQCVEHFADPYRGLCGTCYRADGEIADLVEVTVSLLGWDDEQN